ncbi:MAG: sulfatase-like hydrolase/transferase, partial [Acidimicrobiales bacterium]
MSAGQREVSRGYEGFGGRVGLLGSESTPWWPPASRWADAAPNIVVVLLDDLGFSDFSPFGAEISTPAAEQLAADGYLLTNYHTCPLCSPARASLLTSLNPHRAGFGFVANIDPGFPGFRMEIAPDVPTIAETLREAGYATFMVGKWHLTKEENLNDGADRSSWPVQRGFDCYYGCMDAFTPLLHPNRLVRDNTSLVIDEFPPDYYLTDDLTEQALRMLKGLRGNRRRRPFFLYFAHNAVHGPLQAKAAELARYRGRYDDGWEALRNRRFASQVERGLFPPDLKIASASQHDLEALPEW